MTITKVATTTLQDGWPLKSPNVAAHLNVGAGVDTPNVATYVGAGEAGKTVEYGGFDFSAIPAGATINSIKVRQFFKGSALLQFPGVRFGLEISGVERAAIAFGVDTEDEQVIGTATFASPAITRDELAAGLLSVTKLSTGNPTDPPLPQG